MRPTLNNRQMKKDQVIIINIRDNDGCVRNKTSGQSLAGSWTTKSPYHQTVSSSVSGNGNSVFLKVEGSYYSTSNNVKWKYATTLDFFHYKTYYVLTKELRGFIIVARKPASQSPY